MSYYQNFKSSEKFVAAVLREKEDTRGDDRKLCLEVWERQGLQLDPKQREMFMKVMSPETIRRNRQKIQETGFYRPSMDIWRQRQLLAEDMRENI